MNNCTCYHFEEIHGFCDPDEYSRFYSFVEELAAEKLLEEIPADPAYNKGMILGGRWFRCNGCNKIWRLIPPDFPFRGLWEPVKK